MPRTKIIICFFSLAILQAATCLAENWGLNGKNELPPEADENRIIKWCDDQTGENIRFSSANIKIKGYHPCGAIVSSTTCDAEGNKILGNPKSGIFTDCKEKNDKKIEQADPKAGISPLSHSELKELKSVMKDAADKQNSDPEVELQILADKLMATFLGGKSEEDLLKMVNSKDTQKMMQDFVSKLEKSLPLIDPQSRKLIEVLLGNVKKSK